MITNRETWTLRRQFVVPLGFSIAVIAGLISLSTAWVSQRLERRAVEERFDRVAEQLESADYPLNASVLSQIRSYSGLDLILLGRDGRVRATSLPEPVAGDLSADVAARPRSTLPQVIDHFHAPALRGSVYAKTYPMGRAQRGDAIDRILLVLPETQLAKRHASLVWAPALTGMVSVLLLMLVTTWIASKLAKRIELLESHVDRLSTRDYMPLTLPGPKDALFRLSERTNSLAKQLSIAQSVIEKTERSRLISMVASGLAHEIRNTIAGARLLIETAARGRHRDDTHELRMAITELDKGAVSIKRILASDPKSVLTEESDMTLHQISKSLLKLVDHHGSHQNVGVAVRTDDRDCLIPQGTAVHTCLLNLAINAIEATGSGGAVEIAGDLYHDGQDDSSAAHVVWKIWDDGPGPPEAIAAEITEPFVTSKREGVGLGLAMVTKFADQLGGGLTWYRDRGRTCFKLSVPATLPVRHPAAPNG